MADHEALPGVDGEVEQAQGDVPDHGRALLDLQRQMAQLMADLQEERTARKMAEAALMAAREEAGDRRAMPPTAHEGHLEVRDDASELARVSANLAQAKRDAEVEAMRAEELERRYQRHTDEMERKLRAQSTQAPSVIVSAPAPLPRLRHFTGRAPASKEEATYSEWRRAAKSVDPSTTDALGYLKRSLGGVALSQGQSARSIPKLLELLDGLYGDTKTFFELYEELSHKHQGRGQSAADFLSELMEQLGRMGERQHLEETEVHQMMYQAFLRACNNNPLTREVRARYGPPGPKSPSYQDLLRYVRQIEDLDSVRARDRPQGRVQATAAALQREDEEAVAAVQQTAPSQSATAGRGRERGKRPFHCLNCGLAGHNLANCGNPPNEAEVRRQFGEDGLRRAAFLRRGRRGF